MSGAARSGRSHRRRWAWVALVLALLAPARAAALCCVDAAASGPAAHAHEAAHPSHGAASHPGPELSSDPGDSDCGSLQDPAPALRERGPTDDGPLLVPIPPLPLLGEARAPAPGAFARDAAIEVAAASFAPLRI